MSFKQHRFGRYVILEPLAVGGMAEIFLAKLADSDMGVGRILVIKKVIASYSSSEDFARMFEDEIKITVGLSHQCIVQIYDYGRIEDISFLAMEYVEGKTLRQFLRRLLEKKINFSIDMSCYIISQVASALSYAHNFHDRLEGEHLAIVHRDVSPQNIMISYGGAIKLFDFGIAKAKSSAQETRAGIIKGKPSYLSPEQISGEDLDARSDIFALGVVFWETLTSRRLFYGENDVSILHMIQSGKLEAPSIYNPEVPKDLESIVFHSLQRNRNKRYQSAEELQRALHAFIYSYNPQFNPADLSAYAHKLFEKEIIEGKEKLRLALEICRREGTDSLRGGSQGFKDLDLLFDRHKKTETGFHRRLKTFGTVTSHQKRKEAGRVAGRTSRSSRVKKQLRNKEDFIPPWSMKESESKEIDLFNRSQSRSFPIARVPELRKSRKRYITTGAKGINLFIFLFLTLTPAFLLIIYGAGFFDTKKEEDRSLEQEIEEKYINEEETVAKKKDKKRKKAYSYHRLLFKTNESNYTVKVDGRKVLVYKNAIRLPDKKSIKVVVSKENHKDISFFILDRPSQDMRRNLRFQKLKFGYLTITSSPGADVTLQSKGREPASSYTPIRKRRLPVGVYEIIIENDLIGYKSKFKAQIKEGETTRIHKELK